MFTWICPQCGREVPPAYNECPDCSAKTAGDAPPAAATAGNPAGPAAPPRLPLEPAQPPQYAPQQAPPPVFHPTSPLFQAPPPQPPQYAPQPPQYAQQPPQYAQQPQQYGQQPPQYAPQPQYAPRPRGRLQLPTWLLALLFACAIVGVGGGAIWLFTGGSGSKATAVIETPVSKENPVQKYIEITGLRFAPTTKGVAVSFVVVNHSDSDLVNLAGTVKVWGLTQKKEEDPVGTFTFQTAMAAQTSKELQMPFATKLKMVELPDWQNVKVDVQITAPPGA
jgi:hypothetical protein